MNQKIFVGFDGYVDRIVRIIRQQAPGKEPDFYRGIGDFGDRVLQAAGLSSEFEMYRQEERAGGNAPIMANALAVLGADVTLAAAVEHPVFDALSKKASVFSLGAPAECIAMEFEDGKLMLADSTSLNSLDYSTLISHVNEDQLKKLVKHASVIALVNYCGITQAYDLWEGFLRYIAMPGKMWYFDLADPSKYPPEHLIRCLCLLRAYRDYGEVVLGVNRNEAEYLIRALDILEPSEIVRQGYVDTLLVHPREGVHVIDTSGEVFVKGRLVEHPKVSTGGGDHFNAGYCFGIMQGMNKTEAAALGTRVSGAFVTDGVSPDYQKVKE